MDKLYIVTRSDMSPGYQGVQSIHAAIQFGVEHPEIHKLWFESSNYLAWLAAKDEGHLL